MGENKGVIMLGESLGIHYLYTNFITIYFISLYIHIFCTNCLLIRLIDLLVPTCYHILYSVGGFCQKFLFFKIISVIGFIRGSIIFTLKNRVLVE